MNRILRTVPGWVARSSLSRCSPHRFVVPHINPSASPSVLRTLTTSFRRPARFQTKPLPRPRSPAPPEDAFHDFPRPQPPKPEAIPKPELIVGVIIGTCTAIYLLHEGFSQQYLSMQSPFAIRILTWYDRNMALSVRNIREGRYYTLLTSTLTHYNFLHLGVNMLALWGFGRTIISLYGVTNFAILWAGSGLTGGLLQTYFWKKNRYANVNTRAFGASGAILGMFSVVACVMPRATVQFIFVPMPIWAAAGITAGFSIAALKEGWVPALGHAAHLGGMAFGVAWWILRLRRGGRVVRYRGF